MIISFYIQDKSCKLCKKEIKSGDVAVLLVNGSVKSNINGDSELDPFGLSGSKAMHDKCFHGLFYPAETKKAKAKK